MEIRIRNDSVEISGYVNAIERDSKPLRSRIGQFVERICKGAFKRALERNDDVHVLLNHNWTRDLGSTKKGNLELVEDPIGLRACAKITDSDVIQKARDGDLVGWSFGFADRDVERSVEDGLTHRAVKDLDLYEVSILDRSKTPAYEGTLIMARDEGDVELNAGEELLAEVSVKEERAEEKPEEKIEKPETVEDKKTIDYSPYEAIVEELKKLKGANP